MRYMEEKRPLVTHLSETQQTQIATAEQKIAKLIRVLDISESVS